MGAESYADYHRAIHDPDVVLAMIEDFRAGLGPDRDADNADRARGRMLTCATLVACSTQDYMEQLYGDVIEVWTPWASDFSGRPIHSRHIYGEGEPPT